MRKRREAPTGSEEKLKSLLKATKDVKEIKRIQSVYFRIKYDYSTEVIGDMVGYNPGSVRRIHSKYWKYGEESLISKQKGGRNRENISIEEQKTLLSEFTEKATEGGILEVSKIKDAYDKKVGKEVHESTVYRMLARHGWRKIAPRPHHPKNDDKPIAEYKKTSTM
jgi:transposase